MVFLFSFPHCSGKVRRIAMKNLNNGNGSELEFLWFSEFLSRPIYAGKAGKKLGKLTDLIFELIEPHPHARGIFLDHGWGKPTEFIPWDRIVEITPDAIYVEPPENADAYPPFQDQPGWMLLNQHLMGRSILDIDGRKVEVVNDIHLLLTRGHLIIVHVDTSMNGFLRKWGIGNARWVKDRLISWKWVQPFSVEDAIATDSLSLAIKREQALDMPGEDLADVVEVLSGEQQEAFFSALDAEKAAETLIHAEPRARRQLIEDLTKDRARSIFAELSLPQLADIFSDLPHDDVTEFMELLSDDHKEQLRHMLYDAEVTAQRFMVPDFLSFPPEALVGETLHAVRHSELEMEAITYIYVVTEAMVLTGVVDIRELLLASDDIQLKDIMSTSVVSTEETNKIEDVEEMFDKYHFRMIPVVDTHDRLIGTILGNDLIKYSDQ
jgi:magnesium transporter